MGIFTTLCPNISCRRRVSKGASVCRYCATKLDQGRTLCVTCDSEVALSSKFCWKCGNDLVKNAKPLVVGEKWQRQPGELAVRINALHLKLTQGNTSIEVPQGSRAILLEAGVVKAELHPGRADLGHLPFWKALVGGKPDPRYNIVIYDVDSFPLDIENDGLESSDPLVFGMSQRVWVKVSDVTKLYASTFQDGVRLTQSGLEEDLAREVQPEILKRVASISATELFSNVDARESLASQTQEALEQLLLRRGLEVTSCEFLGFIGESYDRLRSEDRRIAELEASTSSEVRRHKVEAALREGKAADRIHQAQTAAEVEDAIRQAEHDLGMKGVIRQDEMDKLKAQFTQDKDHTALIHQIEMTSKRREAERAQALEDLHSREDMSDISHQRELKREQATFEQTFEQKKRNLDILRDVKQIEKEEALGEVEVEQARLKAREGVSLEALISFVGAEQGAKLVDLARVKAQEGQSPEKILAMAAMANPDAAKALAQKLESMDLSQNTQMAQMKEVLQQAIDSMGQVAASRAAPEAAQNGTTVNVQSPKENEPS